MQRLLGCFIAFAVLLAFACESSTNYTPPVDGDGETDIDPETDAPESGDMDAHEDDADLQDGDGDLDDDLEMEPDREPPATQGFGEACTFGKINAGAGACREGECMGFPGIIEQQVGTLGHPCQSDEECYALINDRADCVDGRCGWSYCSIACSDPYFDCSYEFNYETLGCCSPFHSMCILGTLDDCFIQ